MIKNRKIVALICAMAMIFSVFAGMTVVNAEEITQGIVLEYDAENSGETTAVVVAKAVGFETVESFTVNINLPEGATFEVQDALISGGATGANGYSAATDTAVAVPEDGVLVKYVITLAEPMGADFEVSLQAKSGISVGTTKLSVERANLPEATTTIPKYVDPNATPVPTPMATRAPKPEVDPDATVAPTKEPVTVEQGIVLEYDAENSAVVAKAVGFETVESYTVNINLPEGATFEVQDALISGGATGANGYSAATDTAVAVPEDGVLVKYAITFASPLTEDFVVELQAKSGISVGTTKLSVERANLPIAWTTIPVASEDVEIPDAVGTVTLPDVNITTDDIPADAAENDSLYIAVQVTKKDGSEAAYGVDYAATIGDKTLTEEEFSNVINGYFDLVDGVDSWEDVINNLKIDVYDAGTKVSAQLIQQAEEGDTVVAGGDKTVGKTQATPAPKAPKLTTSVSKSTVYTTDKGVKITVKVTNPAEDGVLSYEVSGTAVTNVAFDAETGVLTFDGNAKGTANFTFTYTYTNADGEEATVTAKKSVSVKVKSVSDGSSSSSSSSSDGGDGPIANGNYGTTTTPGVLPGTTFTDLGSVTWAQEAINKLAAMGAINGRGNGIFDPNANITRAEYCQILVNAIGKSQEAADSNFDDVDTNAWYYHSVSVASAYGIVSGYGDGNFGPNNLITRRDMALMTMKAAQVMGVDLTAQRTLTFADADQFDYAAEAVNTLANAGIINGMSETEFAPLANATRAQAAKIIYDTFVK